MRCKDLLYGVSPKCSQCIHICRQWKQVIVVFCPLFCTRVSKKKRGNPPSVEKGVK